MGLKKEYELEFEGTGIVVDGEARRTGKDEHVFQAEIQMDGKPVETCDLPTDEHWRRDPLFWAYGLAPGKHRMSVRVLNPTDGAELILRSVVIYGADRPGK